jgi:flagellar motor component MotA
MVEILTKRPLESKKFILATLALIGALVVWVASFVAVIASPASAGHVVTLATLIVTLLGAVAGAGITGQSFVDWKATSALTQTSIDTREERIFRVEKLDPKDLDDGIL